MEPLDTPISDVMTIAKKDIKKGEILERFGGFTNYGTMELAVNARKLNALPAGLSPGAEIIKEVKKGEIITWDDVKLDETSTVVKLRRQQDQLFL